MTWVNVPSRGSCYGAAGGIAVKADLGGGAYRAAANGLGGLAGRDWPAWKDKVVAFLEATKLRSVLLLAFVGLTTGLWARRAAAAAGPSWAGPGAGDVGRSAALASIILGTIAVGLGSMGANAITGAIDYRMDAVMMRTRTRPVPTGRLTPAQSLWFGVGLVAASVVFTLWTGHLWSTVWLLAGVLDVTILYNGWSKPRTPWSVVLGSPAGGAPVLVAASAVAGAAGPVAFYLAALVAVWTPIHVWSLAIRYVDDYRAAGVPMLPVAVGVDQAARCVGWASLLLCGLAAGLPAVLDLGRWGSGLLYALQVPIVGASLAVMFRPTPRRSWTLFKLSSPYLALLFVLVAVA